MKIEISNEVFDKETHLIGTVIGIQEYNNSAQVEFSIGGIKKQWLIPVNNLIKIQTEEIGKRIARYNSGRIKN